MTAGFLCHLVDFPCSEYSGTSWLPFVPLHPCKLENEFQIAICVFMSLAILKLYKHELILSFELHVYLLVH